MFCRNAWVPILRWLGVDGDILQHIDRARLTVDRPALLLLAGLLFLPMCWWIYRRQRERLGSSKRLLALLTATRILLAGLILLMLAGPRLAIDATIEQKPVVSLMIDRSESMNLPTDASSNETRIEALRNRLEHSRRTLLDRLTERFDVRTITFAGGTRLADSANNIANWPTPDGRQTSIGDALHKAASDLAGRPLGGAVLFSDGRNTTGPSPVEAAAELAKLGGSVFAVAVGSKQPLPDVAIVDASAPGVVFVGDTARIAITIESHGLAGTNVPVRLLEGKKLLDSRDLVLREGEQQRIELAAEFSEPGDRYLTVEIPVQATEHASLKLNNIEIVPVRVTADRRRVLYVDGRPRWDFRFLKNALRRDRGVTGLADKEPDIVLEAEITPSTIAAALPRKLENLSRYHTVILGDVSAKLLSKEFVAMLSKAVRENGLGLIVAAGPQFMPSSMAEELRALLPLRPPEKSNTTPATEAPAGGMRIALTPVGQTHELMQLTETVEAVNAAWSNFPPFYWWMTGVKPKPGASVLANAVATRSQEANDRPSEPLIAFHQAGKGKVLFIGTDSTWLWRQNVGDRYFYRFWGQAIQFVGRDDPEIANRTRLELRPRRPRISDDVRVELHAFDANRKPRSDDRQTVSVSSSTGQIELTLERDDKQPGRYLGKWTVSEADEHHIRFGASAKPEIETTVRVAACPDEYRKTTVNRELLAEIATGGGGQLFELALIDEIPDQIQVKPRLYRLQKDAALWDNWLLLAVAVAIYAVDIAARRLNGLS